MDWIKYFIINDLHVSLKINQLKQGIHRGNFSNTVSVYHDDIKNGLEYSVYPYKQLNYIEHYKNGELEGIACNWHANGRLHIIVTFDTKTQHRIWQCEFSSNGDFKRLFKYKNNNLHGYQHTWNSASKKWFMNYISGTDKNKYRERSVSPVVIY